MRLCTGGVRVPLNELASSGRVAGINAVLRKLKADEAVKVFLSKEADARLLSEILEEAKKRAVPGMGRNIIAIGKGLCRDTKDCGSRTS